MKICTPPISSSTQANDILHEFFSCYHPHEALQETEKLYHWACKEKYYNKAAPGSLLFLAEHLERLFSAAEYIYYSTGKKGVVILLASVLAPPQPEHYADSGQSAAAWQYFPRHLSAAEYLNPYLVFETFAQLPPWEPVLQELVEYSLSKCSIEGSYPIGELMRWKERMMAVVEAAWLIEIRNKE